MARSFATLLILLVVAGVASCAELYRSNELGMEIAPLAAGAAGKYQWVLEVERSGAVEVRTLTDHGKEVTRWERSYSGGRLASESVFQQGALSSVTDFRNGHPVRQVEYADGKESTIHDYAYSAGLLKSVSVYDASGKLQYRDLYSEGADGRLRRAVREPADGSRSVTALNFSGDRLISEWLGVGHDGVLFRYSDGALVSKEQWTGTDLTSEEEISTGRGGESTVTKDFQHGLVTKKSYNPEGRIVSEQTTENGTSIRTVDYTYSEGRLESKVTKTAGHREEVRYQYDRSGDLLTAETTVNRQLVKVTHYTGKDSYFEDLYLDGQIVLHVFYENGKKVKQIPAVSGGTTGSEGSAGG